MALTTDVKAELVSIRNAPPTVRVAEGSARERIEAVISTGSDPDDPEDD